MRRTIAALCLIGVYLVTLGASDCATPTGTTSGGSTGAPAATKAAPSNTHTVRYLITVGSAGQSYISYMNDQGGIEQVADYQGDWDKSYTMKNGQLANINAQNERDSGSVACTIYVDGAVWKHSESSGGGAMAACHGVIGQ